MRACLKEGKLEFIKIFFCLPKGARPNYSAVIRRIWSWIGGRNNEGIEKDRAYQVIIFTDYEK
jgi:hypothetical protein